MAHRFAVAALLLYCPRSEPGQRCCWSLTRPSWVLAAVDQHSWPLFHLCFTFGSSASDPDSLKRLFFLRLKSARSAFPAPWRLVLTVCPDIACTDVSLICRITAASRPSCLHPVYRFNTLQPMKRKSQTSALPWFHSNSDHAEKDLTAEN